MVQKWYNRILWTSLLTWAIGMFLLLPIILMLEISVPDSVAAIVPVSGCIAVVLIFVGGLTKHNYFGHWVNSNKKSN